MRNITLFNGLRSILRSLEIRTSHHQHLPIPFCPQLGNASSVKFIVPLHFYVLSRQRGVYCGWRSIEKSTEHGAIPDRQYGRGRCSQPLGVWPAT
ncbi:hypothetical protein RSAG8_01981, partial [Rhizoctonia solani AG-8 WAC10335]